MALDEIQDDLQARRSRARHEGWLGEIEGIDLTLTFLRQKRDQTRRLARIAPVNLGIPGMGLDCSSQASRSSTPRAVDSSQNKLWVAAQHRTVGLLSAIREEIVRRPSSDARKSR